MVPDLEILDCPLLAKHAPRQNVAVRCNGDLAGEVDVVLHFHGYGAKSAFSLRKKVEEAGLGFANPEHPETLLRARPTITIIPVGQASGERARIFPALARAADVEALIRYVLDHFQRETPLSVGRRIVSGHSGGGAPIVKLVADPDFVADEIHLYDALYTSDATLKRGLASWVVTNVIARNRGLLDTPDADAAISERGGAFRVICTSQGGTKAHTVEVAKLITRGLEQDEPTTRASLVRRARCELTRVGHSDVARKYAWQLLADAGAMLQPETTPI